MHCALKEKQPTRINWTRVFSVRQNTYDVGVEIRNPNPLLLLESFEYEIRIYDERDVVITKRLGRSFALPGQTTHVIETNLESEKTIRRATFEIKNENWILFEGEVPDVVAGEREHIISTDGAKPRSIINATVFNRTVKDYSNIEVGVVLLDQKRNIVAVSKSRIDQLKAGESQRVSFFWPDVLPDSVTEIQIEPRVQPKR